MGKDQARATVQGVVDICCVPTSYLPDIVPASDMLSLSKHRTAADERTPGGLYDAIQELSNEAGLYYIGRESGVNPDFFFNIINKKVVTPYDLAGTRIAASVPKWEKAWAELGVAFSVIPASECYTAMERGVVDGYNYPLENHVDMGLHEITKYVIDHGFFCDNVVQFMNLDTWNSLPPDMQDLVKEVQIEIEQEVEDMYWDQLEVARQKCAEAGMEFIKFSPTDADWYLDVFYSNEMEDQIEDFPEVAPRLAELLGW